MILYIAVALITVLLATMIKPNTEGPTALGPTRQQLTNRICLLAIFSILLLLGALRVNVGNDYMNYVEFMHRLYTDAYIDDAGVPTEIGFNLLCRVIYGLSGYENYLLIFAIYCFVTVAIFMLALYEQSEDFPLSFFMFMALGYYFQSFSTVRYYLTLAIALYSIKFVLRKQWVRFICLVLIGACFHKSLLVIIPLYFLACIDWKKWQVALVLLFCTTGLFLQDFYLKIVVFLYPTYAKTNYLSGTGRSYINILRCVAVLVAGMLFYNKVKADKAKRFFFYCNLGALALYIFASFIPFVSRIAYYLSVTHILFLPSLLLEVQSEKWRKWCRLGLIVVCIGYFAMYLMKASDDGVLVLPYTSWLFTDMVDIFSDRK